MTDKHPIRNSVIGGVITGIILAALGRIWPPASRFFASVWATLSASVAVPVWVLALVALAVLGLVVLTVLVRRAGVPSLPEATVRAAAAPRRGSDASGISILGRAVLGRIAKADGAPVPQDTIKRSLGTTNLGLQAAVDQLVALDLVELLEDEEDDEDGEVALLLTARGRQYALEHRLTG